MTSREVKYVLLNKVQDKIGRKLKKQEENRIISAYNAISPDMVKKTNTSTVINKLSDIIVNKLNRKPYPENTQLTTHTRPKVQVDKSQAKPKLQARSQTKSQARPKLQQVDTRRQTTHTLQVDTRRQTKPQVDSEYSSSDFDINDVFKNMMNIETDKTYVSYDDNQDNQPDVQYENVEINSVLGVNDISTLKFMFNPSSLYEHYYVVLDTDYRAKDYDNSTTINKFRWYYAETQNLRTGFANSVGKVHDIIGIRMYQPRVHYLTAMDNSAKRISLLIEEFSHQAFIGENGRRFHFLFRPVLSPIELVPTETQIELTTEDYNDGIFHFRNPITTIDTLTISFGDPLTLLNFPLSPTPFERMQFSMEFTCYKSDK